MVNKKFGIVLALAALGLAGCGGTNNGSSSVAPTSTSSNPTTSDSGSSVLPPVVEGKYTLYFHFKASETVASIPSYNSPFIIGTAFDWDHLTPWDETAGKGAVELTALANSDIYYVQVAKTLFADADGKFDATKRGYQLTLGWNASSNAPTDQQGIDWGYKADYNALYPGTSHPLMDAPDSSDRIDIYGATAIIANPDVPDATSDEHWMADPATKVDYMTFAATKPAPAKILQRKFAFTIADKDAAGLARPDYVADFYATGSYANAEGKTWTAELDEAHKLTKDADGYYTISVGDVYSGVAIEYMVVCTVKNSAGTVVTTSFWANKAQQANLKYTPLSSDGNNYTEKLDNPLTWAAWPSDPNVQYDVVLGVTLTDYASKDAKVVGVSAKGAWDGWASVTALTAGATDGVFTATIKMVAGTFEFGFLTVDSTGAQVNWIGAAAGGNASITVSAAGAINYTGTIAGGVTLAA